MTSELFFNSVLPYCDIIVPLLCVYPRGKLRYEPKICLLVRETPFSYSVLAYCDIFLHSVSTLEDVSFVSAEESVADLRDFDELRQEEDSFQINNKFYVPETHIMYFIRRCWFLKCSEEIHYVPIGDGDGDMWYYVPVDDGCARCARDNLRGQKSLGPLKMSLDMAHKVIVPQKKNHVLQFLKQRDINSY